MFDIQPQMSSGSDGSLGSAPVGAGTKGVPLPHGFQEQPIGHVQAYTLGYDRDFDPVPHLASAIGAQVTTYGVPDRLKSIYGEHPVGVAMFVRLRPF